MPYDVPCSRVELPYTYLMDWFVMQCLTLIRHIDEPTEGRSHFLLHLESSKWVMNYIAGIRKIIARYGNYNLYRCFPNIPGTAYGEEFMDVGTGHTFLGQGPFRWLISIQPSHLLCCLGDTCLLEPYVLSRFARQFGYDQLYVGNPNTKLGFEGSLIDGARAWRFFIVGCMGARFCMLTQTPYLLMTMAYCSWYFIANSEVLEYKINSSGLKLIAAKYRGKAQQHDQGKRVRVARLHEYEA